MADTGSDAAGEPRRGVRLTLRLRLTLLYGGVFVAAGAGLLAATYALFTQSQGTSVRTVAIHAVQFQLPPGAPLAVVRAGSTHGVLSRNAPAHAFTSRPGGGSTVIQGEPQAQLLLKRIRTSGQNQLIALARRANVGLRTERTNDASSLLLWSAVALGVVALLSIGLAWWLAGRALRPLRTMNRRARAISAENLNERLGVEDRHDELGELASTFDALLARLEAAFDSQRRFVANASHELRTPLTLERTLAEVALADPHASAASLRRVCERVVASTEQQERLLDALLTLARSEAGVTAGESVDLAVLVHDALLAREAQLAGIAVEVDERGPAVVLGDTALLELLVANLLDNAIVHNGGEPPWIRVSTGEFEGAPGLRIANGGEAVPADRVPELFEPFRRGSGERVGGRDDGLGLGLSIVRAVASAHSARIEGRALPGGGLEFELRFTPVASRVGARI